jgi:hypothetical protein
VQQRCTLLPGVDAFSDLSRDELQGAVCRREQKARHGICHSSASNFVCLAAHSDRKKARCKAMLALCKSLCRPQGSDAPSRKKPAP